MASRNLGLGSMAVPLRAALQDQLRQPASVGLTIQKEETFVSTSRRIAPHGSDAAAHSTAARTFP